MKRRPPPRNRAALFGYSIGRPINEGRWRLTIEPGGGPMNRRFVSGSKWPGTFLHMRPNDGRRHYREGIGNSCDGWMSRFGQRKVAEVMASAGPIVFLANGRVITCI